MAVIDTKIDIAAAYLRAGEVVAIPTETVYGLAGNALDGDAVARIFAVKERPFFDPLIVHVKSIDAIAKYGHFNHEVLKKIAHDHMPGPVTLLLPRTHLIPDIITAGLDRVAIRIPSHNIARSLLNQIEFPLAAPSANPFGYISPTRATHVNDQLGHKIPYILDGGPCAVGVESTIIGVEGGELVVYRKGGLPIDQLISYGLPIRINEHSSSNPNAPGMLKSHYAPSCKLKIVDNWNLDEIDVETIGILTFGKDPMPSNVKHYINLSATSDLNEAAKNLFTSLRKFDQLKLEQIWVKLLPEKGLGLAINDRLRRAAAD